MSEKVMQTPLTGGKIVQIPTRYNVGSIFYEVTDADPQTPFTGSLLNKFAMMSRDEQCGYINTLTQKLVVENILSGEDIEKFREELREEFVKESHKMYFSVAEAIEFNRQRHVRPGSTVEKTNLIQNVFEAITEPALTKKAAELLARHNREKRGDRATDIVFQDLRNG